MNREQRRRAAKQIQKRGYKRDTALAIVDMDESRHSPITDDTKVKLNVARIKKTYSRWNDSDKFRTFLIDNRNTVFTARKDGNVYVLDEDTSDPKWEFLAADLIVVMHSSLEYRINKNGVPVIIERLGE